MNPLSGGHAQVSRRRAVHVDLVGLEIVDLQRCARGVHRLQARRCQDRHSEQVDLGGEGLILACHCCLLQDDG